MNKTQKIPTRQALMLLGTVLLVVLAASLGVLALVNSRMSAYEKTTPEAAVSTYLQQVQQRQFHDLYTAYQNRTGSLSSEDDFARAMEDLAQADPDSLTTVYADNEDGTISCTVYSNNQSLALLTLRQQQQQWQVEVQLPEEENLSYLIDAPRQAQVLVNGIALDERYRKEDEVPSAAFERYSGSSITVPQVSRYEISDLMSPPEVSAEGYQVVMDALEPRFFIGTQPNEQQRQQLEETMRAIAEAAARFTTADGSLSALTRYFLNGSEFLSRIRTMDNQWFTGHAGVRFEQAEISDLILLSDTSAIGKITFDYTVESDVYEDRTYTCGYQITLVQNNGRWAAVDLVINNDLHPDHS